VRVELWRRVDRRDAALRGEHPQRVLGPGICG
jgi:hypothetical protein